MASIEHPTSRNGRHTGDAPEAAPPADAEATAEAVDTAAEATIADPTTAEVVDALPSADVAPISAEIVPGFLSELAVAMQGVAGRERERIAARVADDAAAHIEQARDGGAREAEAFRRIADEDVARIEAWAEREVERIRTDAERRTAERRSDLEATLVQHETVVQSEIEGVEAAVVAYDARLERFVLDLAVADDPERIARMAGSLPRPPDLADVRATARAAAMASIAERAAQAADAGATAEASSDAPSEPMTEGSSTDAATDDGAAVAAAVAIPIGADGPAADTADDGSDPLAALGTLSAPVTAAPTEHVGDDGDSGPVAVMAPPAADADTDTPSGEVRAAADPIAPFGHTNAAVRLIRSVAPWTAPHAPDPEDHKEPR